MSAPASRDSLSQALLQKADVLRAALAEKVDRNLTGSVLQMRSGALRGSIVSAIRNDTDTISIIIESIGVPYAAIQEYGGRTSAHDILATKSKALHFIGSNGVTFAKIVHHPGSSVPARSYLGSAAGELKDDMTDDLKRTILDSLNTH